ncbi:MAG: type II restriction endonuclease [Nitrospira sp.]
MSWPKGARKWSRREILSDARQARELFRQRRLEEPKERYLAAFQQLERANKQVIEILPQLLSDPVAPELIASVVQDRYLLTALRYLGAPPISTDDLRTLVGDTLAPTLIASHAERAKSVVDVIRRVLDPKRFPWMYENRPPTPREKQAAILASSVVASAQHVQTSRRADERDAVEGAVKKLLITLGWKQVGATRKGIQTLLTDAPQKKCFMIGCTVGEHNADIVVRLGDGRVLALECKASNSEINSRKRINKEVAVDAGSWVRRFGEQNVVPAAVIQGVFKPVYLLQAQDTPVVFFWAHRLSDLKTFLSRTN